jgi:DNA polymerase-3 subunit epsilon
MSDLLCELPILVLDCQAAGATPAHGDLLELGWAVVGGLEALGPIRSHWIGRRTDRPVARAIRELTGWTEACDAQAISEHDAWAELRDDMTRMDPGRRLRAAARPPGACVPTAIHFARFELAFLQDLHGRMDHGGQGFPFDAVCLHAIACRLLPDLPRRNIRALAGYLGHSPQLIRRCAGHVEATAFIWGALVRLLEQRSVLTWPHLKAWLVDTKPSPRSTRRVYPLTPERRALPDRPGVYRFLRRSGEVLYVGKAASLKKRVASHFAGGGQPTERALELLTQVHEVGFTETASVLEAALLESDEIKRLDPPYNVQLRLSSRSAWFASRDLRQAGCSPDDTFRVGPLPSERALAPFRALISLAQGADPDGELCSAALAVPVAYLPDERLFIEGWRAFSAEHLRTLEPQRESGPNSVHQASRALWLARGRAERDAVTADEPSVWDLARVRRRLERHLVQGGLLIRRARFLSLLCDAGVAFREPGSDCARLLLLSGGEIVERRGVMRVTDIASVPVRRPPNLRARQASFDGAAYDRLRILITELRRVINDAGEVALRVGAHSFFGPRAAQLMADV